MDTPQNSAQALLEHLGWQMLRRDDNRVAESIVTKREVDGVHNLDEGGLLDGFMAFLEETGFMNYLSSMDVADCQRRIIPIVHLMLTYMAKTLFNINSVYSLPEILFSDPDVMNTLGFNAYLLEHGLSKRSQEKRAPDKDRPKPFCSQMLADFIGKINIREAERLFNEAIASLVRFGAFPRTLHVVLDSTDIEVPEDCPGAGCATRMKKAPTSRKGVREVESTVFGFKAVVLFDLTTQIPIAVKVGKIHRNDARFTRSLLRQAQKNLAGSNCRIKKVMMDRGFLSGRTMWWLDSQGIYFVCPARKDMMVAKHARSLALDGQGYVQQRQRQVQHGHGKSARLKCSPLKLLALRALIPGRPTMILPKYSFEIIGDIDQPASMQSLSVNGITRMLVLAAGLCISRTSVSLNP